MLLGFLGDAGLQSLRPSEERGQALVASCLGIEGVAVTRVSGVEGMVEDAHQVIMLVPSSSDLLALIHDGLLLVALLYRGRTLDQSVRNARLAVLALVVETCLQALEASSVKPEEDGHRWLTSAKQEIMQPAHGSLWLRPDRGPKKSKSSRNLRG